ncbi:uncharacterized protein M421DRAFT_415018 [Didymella exigua CBS 183.55]|uniref:Uncharacterized protein n=1 Tax=Didymella exigua CBS 183.55 TaxID=1150837 RepID=A0A6A5S236_9PLEO|nr:uncharacterized protein M421DRAFT_415018 [Didymella exigua CBS 183.55]KAF1933963.1 hypothetical protein M421DRAFT_415018 [Didymella exigua CBS 183.55]
MNATIRRRTEKINAQQTSISKMTTRHPTEMTLSPEPVIERALNRQGTGPSPSPEEIIRRMTTRKRTEPVEVLPAPPSPSKQAEEHSLSARVPPSYVKDVVLPISRAVDVRSRTAKCAPGRDQIDRASTVDPSQKLVPIIVRRDASTHSPKSAKIERQTIRWSPESNGRPSQVLISSPSPVELERKASTAAPGIVVVPSQSVQRDRKRTKVRTKPHKKTPNYSPERQYPPAPAYPVRDTPAWTKPDTWAPPLKPEAEPAPKKRKFLALGTKRREKPGHESVRQAPTPTLVRRDDRLTRATPAYARKEDYYPRLAPIVQERRNDYSQAQPAPIWRGIQPLPRVAPVKTEACPYSSYPEASARRDFQPNYQERPRTRADIPYRNKTRQQSFRSQAPKAASHQSPANQDVWDQGKAALRSQAPSPRLWPQAHEAFARGRPVPQQDVVPRSVRSDVRSSFQRSGVSHSRESTDRARDMRAQETRPDVSGPAQEANQPHGASRGELDCSATAMQDGNRRPSKAFSTVTQRPQGQAPELRDQSSGRYCEQGTAEIEQESSQQKDDGDIGCEISSQGQRDSPGRAGVDGISSPNARRSVSRMDSPNPSYLSWGVSVQDQSGGPEQPSSQGLNGRRSSVQNSIGRCASAPGPGVATAIKRVPTGAPVSRAVATGAIGIGEAAPPTEIASPSAAELSDRGSLQDLQTASVRPKPKEEAVELPRRRSSVLLSDVSSSDLYALPQRTAPAKPKPELGRKYSLYGSHYPTRGWFRGKGKGQDRRPPA